MLVNAVINLLPIRCELCQLPLDNAAKNHCVVWCSSCVTSLERSKVCRRCGMPVQSQALQCGRCITHPPLWQQLCSLDSYRFPYDKAIQRFKHQGQFWLAAHFSALLAPQITQPAPVLVPVPMHWKRRLTRGYNQSHLLAFQLAKHLQVACNTNAITRIRHTEQQQGLSRKARLSNLRNAFSQVAPLPPHIAIVDDVVTTGATLNALCREVKKHGVEQIDIYCIARSVGKTT